MDSEATPRRGVMVVMTDVSPECEDSFNRWYDTEHVPERVALPGVRRARRYVRYESSPQPADGTVTAVRGPKYLVVYEFDDIEVLHGAWAELGEDPSAESRRMYPEMSNVVREAFVEIGAFEEEGP